ncbi:hypothetical protein FJY93_03855 [Candidatus Kaiserbacteria bacterium]|nr:hypothetical protein [Candidatus Kaiserbacteria bacterium]
MKTIHLAILLCTAVVMLIADGHGWRWMRGTVATLDRRAVRMLHYLMWTGLSLMIATGLILFSRAPSYYLGRPAFLMKMCVVAILVVNGILIGRLQGIALERPFASLSSKEKLPLMASGAISTAAWIAAPLIGYFLI